MLSMNMRMGSLTRLQESLRILKDGDVKLAGSSPCHPWDTLCASQNRLCGPSASIFVLVTEHSRLIECKSWGLQ